MSSVESSALLSRLIDRGNWRKRINCLDDYPARLNTFEEAPYFLKHNPFIRSGYRGYFNASQCIQSCFRWTNETLNIWTHGVGLAIFLYHIMDVLSSDHHGTYMTETQRLLVLFQLACYCVTMGTSAFYHTFCCISAESNRQCYVIDVIGIILGSVANYLNGVYYLFECYPYWRAFYLVLTTFVALMILISALKSMFIDDPVLEKKRFIAICGWTAAGLFFPVHWMYLNGFAWNEHAAVFFPRFMGFFGYTSFAFVFYMMRLPERLCPGLVDYVGHSHQWWHVFSAVGLYWWYQSAIIFAEFTNSRSICH